jgi:hypothetical protein
VTCRTDAVPAIASRAAIPAHRPNFFQDIVVRVSAWFARLEQERVRDEPRLTVWALGYAGLARGAVHRLGSAPKIR